MFKFLLLTNIYSILFYLYNDIHLFSKCCGMCIFFMYTYIYTLSYNNIYFTMSITPKNYSEPIRGTHKLISYGFSTLHALFTTLCSTLYLFNIIDNYYITQVFFISIGYYLADLYYIIDSTHKLKILDYFTICHHHVMIIMYHFILIQFYNDINIENTLIYYINRGMMSEYSVLTLNYSWYLVNTKQANSNKMFISSILTLILYFITRVLNFTNLLLNCWYNDFILAIIIMMPLFLVNYYWFYKLCNKAKSIYNKLEKS